uniref:Uncharacterized protein n=1 Tax=Chenopodium quinoa TaxID=63459 RepID=A0A803KUE7_CHEQI
MLLVVAGGRGGRRGRGSDDIDDVETDTTFNLNLEEESSSELYTPDEIEEVREELQGSTSTIQGVVKAKGKTKLVKPKIVIKDINPIVYTDNSKSVGGRLKEAGKVIETFQQYDKTSMNMNCPFEIFSRVLGKFDETKTRLVREMGFGTLFYVVGKRLPRLSVY